MTGAPLVHQLRSSSRVVVVTPWMVEELGLAAVWFAQVLWRMEVEDRYEIVRGDGDWAGETGLSRSQVLRARTKVQERGWITCRVRKVAGTPTTHIGLEIDALEADLRAVHCSISDSPGSRDIAQSSTSQMALEGVRENRATEQSETAQTTTDPTTSFDAFWSVYPRRVGRRAAEGAWAKAVTRADVETILAGAGRYAAEVSGTELRYVAHPTTWLNQDRWMDDAGANRGNRGGGPLGAVSQDRSPTRRIKL